MHHPQMRNENRLKLAVEKFLAFQLVDCLLCEKLEISAMADYFQKRVDSAMAVAFDLVDWLQRVDKTVKYQVERKSSPYQEKVPSVLMRQWLDYCLLVDCKLVPKQV